jgi:hypothetical protein
MTSKKELKKRMNILRPKQHVTLVYVPGAPPSTGSSWYISSEEELEKQYEEAVRLHGEENVRIIEVVRVGSKNKDRNK